MPRESLNIAVDYDGTFNANPAMMCSVIGMFRKYGCDVRIVTFRFPTGNNEDIKHWANELNLPVIFTDGKQKAPFCEELGFPVDIWIDDDPKFIPHVLDLECVARGCRNNGEK